MEKSQILKYAAFAIGGLIIGGMIALFEFSIFYNKTSGTSSACSAPSSSKVSNSNLKTKTPNKPTK